MFGNRIEIEAAIAVAGSVSKDGKTSIVVAAVVDETLCRGVSAGSVLTRLNGICIEDLTLAGMLPTYYRHADVVFLLYLCRLVLLQISMNA